MPEGPEIRYLSELLKKHVIGKKLEDIVNNTATKIKVPKKSLVNNIGSKGKTLWIETNDYYVHLHFGLTGWLYFEEGKHTRFILKFSDINVYLDDKIKLAKVNIYDDKESHDEILENLGADILGDKFTIKYLSANLKDKNSAIGAILLEQNLFAGVGNYIRNDALYIAGINPLRKCKSLTDDEITGLYDAIKFVSYSNLIDHLNNSKIKIPQDIKNNKPKKIESDYSFKVYGRTEDDLKNKIITKTIGGRKAYIAESVQK